MSKSETYKEISLSEGGRNSMQLVEKRGNKLVLSSLTEFYEPVDASGFSIKYVSNGTEFYTLDSERYIVGPNHYLLTNRYKSGQVEIQSPQPVQGICVTLAPEILVQAVASFQGPGTEKPDEELGQFFNSALFPDDQFYAGSTKLGNALEQLSLRLDSDPSIKNRLNMEFFFELAEYIIQDQTPVFKQLRSIPSLKTATKKDLYKKIRKGQEFIDHAYHQAIDVETIANYACMSEFHFYRLFKTITGISPHQYLLKKRLEKAHSLLTKGTPVKDAALLAGFSDIYSFSKSFKKQFGLPPSRVQRK